MANTDDFEGLNGERWSTSAKPERSSRMLSRRERRKPENAGIRRWIDLGDKALSTAEEPSAKRDPGAA